MTNPDTTTTERLRAAAIRAWNALLPQPPGAEGAAARVGGRTLFHLLVALAAVYTVAYLAHDALPGRFQAPLGWWSWFDQGKYLRSMQALANLDFRSELHHYPIGYAALGVLFYGWMPVHPLFVVNLACVLIAAWAFVRLTERVLGFWIGVALFGGLLVADPMLFGQVLIPWTTTPVLALLYVALLRCAALLEAAEPPPWRRYLVLGLLVGAIVPFRPVDLAAGLPLAAAVLVRDLGRRPAQRGDLLPRWGAGLAGLAVGPLLFAWSHLAIHGGSQGAYLSEVLGNGFHPGLLGEKFYSLFIDGEPVYLAQGAAIFQRYPWMVAGLAALAYQLVFGRPLLRAAGAAILTQGLVYLAYSDLLPTSLWNYLNIHYFLWWWPLLGLLLAATAWDVVRVPRRRLAAGVVLLLTLGVFAVRLERVEVPMVTQVAQNSLTVRPPEDGGPVPFRAIDIFGASGSQAAIYIQPSAVAIDGRPLTFRHDYHLLPAPAGLRLLMLTPRTGGTVELRPDEGITLPGDGRNVVVSAYRFRPRVPFSGRPRLAGWPAAPYELGTALDFSAQGNAGIYMREGFSRPEAWGTWTDGDRAVLALHLAQAPPGGLELRLSLAAFVGLRHPSIEAAVRANGVRIGTERFDRRGERRDVTLKVPPAALARGDGSLVLEFDIDEPASPAGLGVSTDPRSLGLAFYRLVLDRQGTGAAR